MSEQESKSTAGPSDTKGPSSPAKSNSQAAAKTSAPKNHKAPPNAGAKGPAPPRERRAGRGALWLAILALLIALGAILGGVYLWREQQSLRAHLQSQGSELTQAGAALRNESSRGDQQLQTRADQLEQAQQELRQAVESVRELAGRSRRDWLLAEVEYLLRIANRRLQLQHDVITAIAALQIADQRLRELADPGLTDVRERIARELAALRATPRPDIEGMALQLASLGEQVPQLQVRAARAPARSMPAAVDTDREHLSLREWRQGLARAWEALKRLVVIRRRDEPIAPLLGPEEEFAVREGLRLQLQGARVALLRQDPQLFGSSIQGARDWLQRYFVAEGAAYQAMDQSLQQLGAQQVRVAVPDISESLRKLLEIMQQRGLDTELNAPSQTPAAADQPSPAAPATGPEPGAPDAQPESAAPPAQPDAPQPGPSEPPPAPEPDTAAPTQSPGAAQ